MNDHERIQGRWRVVSDDEDEKIIPIGNELIGSKIRYVLRPDARPGQIDLEHRAPGNRPRSSSIGIYRFENNRLYIDWVYEGDRPVEFTDARTSGKNHLVLDRLD